MNPESKVRMVQHQAVPNRRERRIQSNYRIFPRLQVPIILKFGLSI